MDIIKNVVGSNIDIEDSNGDKIVDVGLLGDTSQDGTPTPDTPVEVKTVTGRQDIVVCGKNLLDYQYSKLANITRSTASEEINGFKITSTGARGYGYASLELDNSLLGQTITISMTSSGTKTPSGRLFYTNTNGTVGSNVGAFWTTNNSYTTTLPSTLPSNARSISLVLYISQGNNTSSDYAIFSNIQIEKSSQATTYEAYKGNTYEINLGKNLFDASLIGNYTSQGVNVSQQGQEVILSGTPTRAWGSTPKKQLPQTLRAGETYYFSSNSRVPIRLWFYASTTTTTIVSNIAYNTSFTPSEDVNAFAFVFEGLTVGQSYNERFTLQVEKGSSASSYAEYKEPIELCKIGNYQDRIFKSSGKNLANIENIQINKQWTGGYNSNRASILNIPIEPNTQYSIVGSWLNSHITQVRVVSFANIGDGIPIEVFTGTFTSPTTANYVSIEVLADTSFTSEMLNGLRVLLCKGSATMEDYEPYGTGWYLEKNIGKVVLDGTRSWQYISVAQGSLFRNANDIINNAIIDDTYAPYCNYYKGIPRATTRANNNIIANVGSNFHYLDIVDNRYTNATDFKNWLGTHNTSVYYVLATPTYTEITDSELISQLNALEQAQVPYGIAHINVSGDLPTILDLDYYTLDRYITPEDRQALLDGSATIPFRINIIKDGEVIKTLDEYSIVELDYEDFRYVDSESIVIGQFVARKITGKLDQIYTEFEIEDTELEVQIGVSYNNNTTYYSLGNFLVIKPTTDDVKEKTEFEAMDYTKKFNKKFDDTNLIFPCTALELAQYTCDLCGVELGTTSFANDNFIIQDNQYVEGDTCRKVMQDIGKLAYSWVRIDWDNKCYIDFDTKDSIIDYNRITNTEYYDLSLQREVLGPVNRVVIGIRDVDGENAVIEDSDSIEEYGVTEIQLYDNNLTYTPELRLQAIQAATRLFGLTYLPLETNTIGHPWLIGNERIEVKDMNDNLLYTYPWDRTIAYNGHIKSKLVSKADTKTETEYRNYGDLETATRQTRIIVDKQNQTIEALAEAVQPISNEISNVGSITLENAYEGTLHRLEIKGSISALFPSTTLYPSTTSYPLTPTLKVDDTLYVLGFTTLRYINSSTCDLYVYEDGKQWVERNIGVDGGGNLYELPDNEKYIEELPDITIQVSSSSVISLDGFANANLKALYLLENDYTDTFATNVDLVSKINISPSNIAIQSHKIALEGYTTINGNFWVDLEGNMHARSGSFEGNIMLPNGGRVIGGDGLFSCLAYTSTGRFSNWDIIGFGTSGANVSDTDVRYADIFVNAYIPENFTITGAYAILEVTSVNSSYTDASGDYEVVGTPKDIGLLVGVGDTSVTFFYYPYQAVDEEVEYSGTEIPNAFGNGRYTPSINSPGSVEEAKSIDIKDYLTIGEMNTIFVRSLLSPKPVVKTFTPSGGSYTMYNYEELVRNTGVGRLNLFVFGYMSTDAEE